MGLDVCVAGVGTLTGDTYCVSYLSPRRAFFAGKGNRQVKFYLGLVSYLRSLSERVEVFAKDRPGRGRFAGQPVGLLLALLTCAHLPYFSDFQDVPL